MCQVLGQDSTLISLSVIPCHMTSLLDTCIHVLFGQPDKVAGEMDVHVGVRVGVRVWVGMRDVDNQ